MTGSLARHAARLSHEAQKAPWRHLTIERRAFRQVAHPLLRATPILRDVDIENFGGTVVGLQIPGDHPHRGRLAGPVGSQEADDLPDVERKANAIHGDAAAKSFAQTIDLQQHMDWIPVRKIERRSYGRFGEKATRSYPQRGRITWSDSARSFASVKPPRRATR